MTFIVENPRYNKCLFQDDKHQIKFMPASDDDPLHIDHDELPQVYLNHYELYEWPYIRKLAGNYMMFNDAIFKITTRCDQDEVVKGKDIFVRWEDPQMEVKLERHVIRISRLFISNKEWETFQKKYVISLQPDSEKL